LYKKIVKGRWVGDVRHCWAGHTRHDFFFSTVFFSFHFCFLNPRFLKHIKISTDAMQNMTNDPKTNEN